MSPIKPYPPAVDGLVVTVADGVVTVLFDRAERRNALTDDMVLALTDVVDAATADDSTRVLHLTAAGRDFCTGFDLSLRGGGPPPRTGAIQRRMRWHVGRLMPALVDAQIPIVCSVQGGTGDGAVQPQRRLPGGRSGRAGQPPPRLHRALTARPVGVIAVPDRPLRGSPRRFPADHGSSRNAPPAGGIARA